MMNIKHKLSIFAAALLILSATACTSESVLDEPTGPDTPGQEDGKTQEVQLMLKNTLTTKQRAARADGDPIATADENYIQSLDVYVFGAKEENGAYTLQELHYFRDDASEVTLPGVTTRSFNLTPTAEQNITTGLLKLQKGLFVKLYCIANRTHLFQTDAGGAMTEFTAFKSLGQSAPGQAANVVTDGVPREADFKKFHTNLINPLTAAPTADDVLATPLPMTGAYTTPLDLTDFSSSARTQISFKLSRMVARFDIVNDANTSKFTIESISMGNGQSAAQFFPIQTMATDAADLISYPERTLSPVTQDKYDEVAGTTNLTTGAFYTWPSPQADKGYLTLKGQYAVNKTETKEVSYKVPFQQMVNGVGSYIEVAYNHRYTIAITKADDYHLDFTLNVTEWDEGGEVDEYLPENSFDRNTLLKLETGAANVGAYVLDNGQIEVLAHAGSKFSFKMGSNTPLTEEIVYKTGSAKWIVKGLDTKGQPRAIASMDSTFTYKVDDAELADRSKLLPVTIRLTNPASGQRKEIKVIPTPGPVVTFPTVTDAAGKYSMFDPATMTATLYNVAGQTAKFHVKATSRSDRAETPTITTGSTVDIEGAPAWLTADIADVTTEEGDYLLTMNTAQTLPASAKVDFISTASMEKTSIKVNLKDPKMDTNLTADNFFLGDVNTVDLTGASPKVTMMGIKDNSFTISVYSPEGVTAAVTGGDTWLDGKAALSTKQENGRRTTVITGKIKDATGMGATEKTDGKITITNILDPTETKDILIETSKPAGPIFKMTDAGADGLNRYDAATKTAHIYNSVGQTLTLNTTTPCTAKANVDVDYTKVEADPTNTTFVLTVQTAYGSNGGDVEFTDMETGAVTTVNLEPIQLIFKPSETLTANTGKNTLVFKSMYDCKITMDEVTAASAFTMTVQTPPKGISVDDVRTSDWLVVAITEQIENTDGMESTVRVSIKPGTDLTVPITDGRIFLLSKLDTDAHKGDHWLGINVNTTVAPVIP